MQDEYNRFPVRKNPRLKSYDYTSYNYYFVTVCTKDKACIFGSQQRLSPIGRVAEECIEKMADHFLDVRIDKWVVMPNHIHAIIILPGNVISLSTVIGQYKAAVSKKAHIFCPDISIWQSSFHDHVIRNQADYERIWAYIDTNPARWVDDCFYTPQPEL